MDREQYETLISKSTDLLTKAADLSRRIQSQEDDKMAAIKSDLEELSKELLQLNADLNDIDDVPNENYSRWSNVIGSYNRFLDSNETLYLASIQLAHKQKFSATSQEQKKETYTSKSGNTYTITDIADYVRAHGIFQDYQSNDRKVYQPLRLFDPEEIEALLEYPEIKKAFMEHPQTEDIREYARGFTEETLNKIYDFAQASKVMENVRIRLDPDKLGEAMGPQTLALYQHLNRGGEEAEGEKVALTMLTTDKDLRGEPIKQPFTDYRKTRPQDFVNDLEMFYKSPVTCGSNLNIAVSKLYALIKSHYEADKIINKQEKYISEKPQNI